jgi:dipeptidyl aminopeptidase/acylaminoacyl peptidase
MMRVLLTVAALLATASASAQVDLDRFLRRDAYETIKISPDGRYYAATIPLEDRTGLAIVRREDMTMVSRAIGVKRSAVADFWWVSDERIVIAMAQSMGSKDPLYVTGELHGLGIDGGRVKTLFGRPIDAGFVTRYGAVEPEEHATLIDPLPADPDHALVAIRVNVAEPQTRLVRMNVHTGRTTTVAHAPVRRARFMVDASGQVRFARGADASNASKLYYREHDGAEWSLVNDEAVSGRVAVPLGMAADGRTAYLQVEQASGPDAVEAWDMATGERNQVQRDEVVDPYRVVYATDMRTPVGVRYMRDGLKLRLFEEDSAIAELYLGLERAFAGSGVEVTSFSNDGRVALVRTWSDRTAGDYFLFDVESRHARGIFAQMDWLPAQEMASTRAISLQARDGVVLHGYLTTPVAKDGPLPMVLLPHGGPFGIYDEWGFDVETQILAAAGYAVLRLNFRGSGNHGRAFQARGARQWGGTMQDDLTDATRWAIAEGVADPARICVYGASYGGYAALMAVAKEPELYRCAAGYVGVYDLAERHGELSRYTRWTRNWVNDWLGERSTLKERSPTELAASIRAPVFLAAGGADYIAPISHSRKMERALKRAGVPVETLFIDSEGHGFTNDANRRRFYAQLLDFLSPHLGGATAQ